MGFAGLILMAQITTNVQQSLDGRDDRTIVGTALMSCSITTVLLGICLCAGGKCASLSLTTILGAV